MNYIKRMLGMSLTPGDKALVEILRGSRYRQSMRVVGRGTLVIPPEEIRKSPRHQEDLAMCQAIVESSR